MAIIDEKTLRNALIALGDELGTGIPLEITIIGGGAALLLGVMSSAITTDDVDAVFFRPPGVVDEILDAGLRVSRKMSLPPAWLSHDDPGLFLQMMPKGWLARRVHIGEFSRLTVFAMSRQDLIATKFFAHRQKDMLHLQRMNVTDQEIAFTTEYLKYIGEDFPDERGKSKMGLHLLQNWGET